MEKSYNAADRDPKVGGFILPREGLKGQVRELSKLDAFHGVASVFQQWIVIGLAIGLALVVDHWFIFLLAIILIATRQYALGVLVHEGAHYRLFRNKKVNDLITDWFCAFWIGLNVSRYRFNHLRHHRLINLKEDPEGIFYNKNPELWSWPKSSKTAIIGLIQDLSGWNNLKLFLGYKDWTPWGNHFSNRKYPAPLNWEERSHLYAFIIVLTLGLYLTNGWFYFFLFWVVPSGTVLVPIFRIGAIAEHMVTPCEHELNETRNILAPWYERMIISPLNVNYHLDHHLFPSVPQYNLPKLHQALMDNKTYRELAYNQKKYIGFSNGLLGDIIQKNS